MYYITLAGNRQGRKQGLLTHLAEADDVIRFGDAMSDIGAGRLLLTNN